MELFIPEIGHTQNATLKCYDYFRYDKQCFFIGSQVATGPAGQLYNFTFSKGHNNDQGVFNQSWIKLFLYLNSFRLLADGGYSNIQLITPDSNKGKSKSIFSIPLFFCSV